MCGNFIVLYVHILIEKIYVYICCNLKKILLKHRSYKLHRLVAPLGPTLSFDQGIYFSDAKIFCYNRNKKEQFIFYINGIYDLLSVTISLLLSYNCYKLINHRGGDAIHSQLSYCRASLIVNPSALHAAH